MNYHQIYNINEISRVFNQLQRVLKQQSQQTKEKIQILMNNIIVQHEGESYLDFNKDKNKINQISKQKRNNININTNNFKQKTQIPSNLKQQTSTVTNKQNKRAQLKGKLRQKLKLKQQNKIIEGQSQNKINETIEKQLFIKQKQKQKQKISSLAQSRKQNEKKQQLKKQNQINYQTDNYNNSKMIKQQIKPSQQNINQGILNKIDSLDLKQFLQGKLTYSPSFNHTILMYYILILQNVIRYETSLLKNPLFYNIYYQGAFNFIFNRQQNTKLLNILKENERMKQTKGQGFKQFKQNLLRQVNFLNVIKSSMMTNSKNKEQALDPHKMLTYLINCRHLLKNNQKQQETIPKKDDKDATQRNKQNKSSQKSIKSILIQYLTLIRPNNLINQSQQKKSKESNNNKPQFSRKQNKNSQTIFNKNEIIQQALNNKLFIKSLKQMYSQQKSFLNKSNKSNESTQQQSFKLIQEIFNEIDKYYKIRELSTLSAH